MVGKHQGLDQPILRVVLEPDIFRGLTEESSQSALTDRHSREDSPKPKICCSFVFRDNNDELIGRPPADGGPRDAMHPRFPEAIVSYLQLWSSTGSCQAASIVHAHPTLGVRLLTQDRHSAQ